MTATEFSNEFDLLYNNITSNQAPGLDEYEKSVFLTKAQDEIIKSYFNPKLNKVQEGFDGSERRQIDFSMLIKTKTYSLEQNSFSDAIFDNHYNSKRVDIDANDIMMFINEFVDVIKCDSYCDTGIYFSGVITTTIFDSWNVAETAPPLSSKVTNIYYYPKLKTFVATVEGVSKTLFKNWSSLHISEDSAFKEDTAYRNNGIPYSNLLYIDYRNTFYIKEDNDESYDLVKLNTNNKFARLATIPIEYTEYTKKMSKPYKRPLKNQAWRLLNTSNGNKSSELIVGPNDTILKYNIRYVKRPNPIVLADLDEEVSVNGVNTTTECELDPIIHHEILQRAVELAKAAWVGDLQSQVALGTNSETNMGIIQPAQSR